jgi:hypothetical protein
LGKLCFKEITMSIEDIDFGSLFDGLPDWSSGGEGCELLKNWLIGERIAVDVLDAVSETYGPVARELVVQGANVVSAAIGLACVPFMDEDEGALEWLASILAQEENGEAALVRARISCALLSDIASSVVAVLPERFLSGSDQWREADPLDELAEMIGMAPWRVSLVVAVLLSAVSQAGQSEAVSASLDAFARGDFFAFLARQMIALERQSAALIQTVDEVMGEAA